MEKKDPRGALDGEPYSWQECDREIHIFWNGNLVTILRNEKAHKFFERVSELKGIDAQLVMAKITGKFKRDNEKPLKQR